MVINHKKKKKLYKYKTIYVPNKLITIGIIFILYGINSTSTKLEFHGNVKIEDPKKFDPKPINGSFKI